MPKIFTRTNRFGTPYVSVLFSLAVATLAFTSVKTSAYTIFTYFVSTVTLFGTIVWMQIMYSNIRFRRACKVHGIELDDLPYRSRLNPYLCYWGLGGTAFLSLTKGFAAFIHPFSWKSFVTNYSKSVASRSVAKLIHQSPSPRSSSSTSDSRCSSTGRGNSRSRQWT